MPQIQLIFGIEFAKNTAFNLIINILTCFNSLNYKKFCLQNLRK